MRSLYAEAFIEELRVNNVVDSEEYEEALLEMLQGEFSDMARVIDKALKMTSFRDVRESFVKALFIALLSHQLVYRVHSELEVEEGYVDLALEPRMEGMAWLVELKYIRKDEDLERKDREGREQLKRYLKNQKLKELVDARELKGLLLVFRSKELAHWEVVEA